MTMTYIVSVSGGLGSFEALRRTIETHGKENTVAVFADVKGDGATHWFSFPAIDALLHERYGGESRDLYRFLWHISYVLDIPIERLSGGATIWTQFAKSRAMRVWTGKGFYCPASELLKRERIAQWIEKRYTPGKYTMVLGMGWDESHRVEKAKIWWSKRMGWDVPITAPNGEKPYADNMTITAWLRARGIKRSKTYDNGFQHDNCNNGCVHAGQGHFAQLYKTAKAEYLYWAYMERQIQQYLGKFVTILKDERGGTTNPLSLYDFIPRIRVEDYRKLDFGACGCFTYSLFDMLEQAKVETAS